MKTFLLVLGLLLAGAFGTSAAEYALDYNLVDFLKDEFLKLFHDAEYVIGAAYGKTLLKADKLAAKLAAVRKGF